MNADCPARVSGMPDDCTCKPSERGIHIDGEVYKIEPASCRCGGSYAWLRLRETGAWEMVGCVCHTMPTGERILNHPMPGRGTYVLLDQQIVEDVFNTTKRFVKPVVDALKKSGAILS